MTLAAPTTQTSHGTMPKTGWFSRAESWLDAKGKGAWIAAMVLGFVFFWPVGLALVAYMTVNNKWAMQGGCSRAARRFKQGKSAMRPTGNRAFDAYKMDTLRRLEEEQEQFEAFLERLREAKDKSEFDSFMDDRAKRAATPEDDAEERDQPQA